MNNPVYAPLGASIRKYTKIKNPETSRVYKQEAIELALDFAPAIYPCRKCGHAVASGYCCGTCHTSEPYEGDEDNAGA